MCPRQRLTVLLGAMALVLLPQPARGADDPIGVWPLHPEPAVVGAFDPPDSAYGAGHRGVDLDGRIGQPVRAALPGRVSFAGRLAGRGVVVVSHGSTRTTYEPVSAAVAVGETVAAGAWIGQLELVGSHCFPRACLHWGWLRGETYLDPLRLVGAAPVRLLPLWRDRPVDAAPPTLPRAAGRAWTPWWGWVSDLWRRPWSEPPVRPAGVPARRPGATGRW